MNDIIKISRRRALAGAGTVAGAALLADRLATPAGRAEAAAPLPSPSFRFCLNMATIRGQKLGIVKEIQIAAQAGYQAIEPWMDSITAYTQAGGKLADLKANIADSGLTLASAIAFPEWLAEDDAKREKGLDMAKHQMETLAQLGGQRLAAPPSGATNPPKLDLMKAAERYRALLDAGDQTGIVPQLELWGFSQNLNRLGECVCVAMETGHPKACVLADVFHLYKGGTNLNGIGLLGPATIQVLHMNDFPTDGPREKLQDSQRVYPGDGAAPIKDILRLLRKTGGEKFLSLELFNRSYWAQDPLEVAKAGLASMKKAVEAARPS